MESFASLRTQPEFPLEDLTDENANTLELLLSNQLVVTQGHTLAERSAWVFRVGHPATMHGTKRIFDGAHIAAISHGVAVFEAMNIAVSGTCAADADMLSVNTSAYNLIGTVDEGRLRGHTITALQDFRDRMPRAAEVVGSASQRFFGPLTEYAILGAALERQIVVDALLVDKYLTVSFTYA